MPHAGKVAGYPQPDKEEESKNKEGSEQTGIGVARPQPSKRKGGNHLRQSSLFRYTVPAHLAAHHTGASKKATDFPKKIESIAWGDQVKSSESVKKENLFRVMSHNVNGLSTAAQNEDVRLFAAEMKSKVVGLFGIQETNRNFRNHFGHGKLP
jgi:hypothetical protein